jgi:hypothetical protein
MIDQCSDDLREDLAAVRSEDASVGAPPTVEAAIIDGFRAARLSGAMQSAPRRICSTLAIAAVTAAIVGGLAYGQRHTQRPRMPRPTDQRERFVLLPGATLDASTDEQIVIEITVPRTVLMSLGLAPSGSQSQVASQVMVGQDGIARAIRVLRSE